MQRRAWTLVGGLAVVLLLAVVTALPALGVHPASTNRGTPRGTDLATPLAGPAFGAAVTWNGADVGSAGSISSAISTNFGSTIDLRYIWAYTGGATSGAASPYNISDARLQMFYFGFPLATRDVVDSTPAAADNGTFDMSWDPGVLQWVLAGTYGVTTSLLAPNGTTMWSESFFVHVNAPGGILAVLPILLILIGIYEVYELARAGRQAATSTAASPPAPKNPAAGADTSTPATESRPDTSAPPPKEGS